MKLIEKIRRDICSNAIITDAIFAILALYESRIAVAIVTAVRVYALAVGADALLLALVLVLALVGLGIPRLSLGALAGERAGSVQALAALAEAGNRFAFVDI